MKLFHYDGDFVKILFYKNDDFAMNVVFCSGDDEMCTVVSCVFVTEREDAPDALVRIRESDDGDERGVSDLEDQRSRCSSTVNVTLTPSQFPSQPQMNQAM